MESILTSIKKLLGIPEEHTDFDADIIIHINSVFMILNQLGVGPNECFIIEDDLSTWNDFMPDDQKRRIEGIKTYIYMKVKLLFDPPANSTVMQSMNQAINEFEWRLNVAVDPKTSN